MGHGLYATEAVFRDALDRGIEVLRACLDCDLRPLLVADTHQANPMPAEFHRPSVQLPAIFLVEHALARLWMSWGVQPSVMIGHSMGEVTAACIAGVFTFEDAVRLMVARGRLVETASGGEMLSVRLGEADLAPLLGDNLDLASVNAPDSCVVSGPRAVLEELADQLTRHGVDHERVPMQSGHTRSCSTLFWDSSRPSSRLFGSRRRQSRLFRTSPARGSRLLRR